MKYLISACLICLAIVFSCTVSVDKTKLFDASNLEAKQYTINVDKDTILRTAKGAWLKIPAGALQAANGNQVTLELKEAYSLSEMIKAGLVTKANDEVLSSGGMIYINAIDNGAKIVKPIKIALPADHLQQGMKLYKGEDNDGKINWTDPTDLPENKQLTTIEKGQSLFQQNCTSCHAIGKTLTGPDLANIRRRLGAEGDWKFWNHLLMPGDALPPNSASIENLELTKKDTARKLDRKDFGQLDDRNLYACNLRRLFGGQQGPPFPVNTEDVENIYDYIQNESDRLGLPLPYHAYLDSCIDSCEFYRRTVDNLNMQKNLTYEKRKKLIKENGAMTKVYRDTTWVQVIAPPPPDFDQKVVPQNYDAVYYQFSVTSFGWWNIDMLLNNAPDVKESELFAKVTGDYKDKVNTFLIIPSVKTYAEAGPADRNPQDLRFIIKMERSLSRKE
jgi:hypothetical protein